MLTQPGKPTQNAYIESFNGKFRDECLNEHWFTSIDHARAVTGVWRRDYNEVRPHSAIGNRTPAAFAATLRERGCLAIGKTTSGQLTNQDATLEAG
jgi:putative transposase